MMGLRSTMRFSVYATGLLVVLGLGLTGCASVFQHISDPGVTVELIASSKAEVLSGHLYRYRGDVVLWGELKSIPVTKSPLPGHVDIEIVSPDGETSCSIVRHRIEPRYFRKSYHFVVGDLPAAGSIIRVSHHVGAEHCPGGDS